MQRVKSGFSFGILGVLAIFGFAGCGEEEASDSCTAGMQTACMCADGTMSYSLCNMDGTPGACMCTGSVAGFGNSTAGTTAGTTVAGTTAGTSTAGTVAGTGVAGTVAGTGVAGTTAGTGVAGTTAGTGVAGTTAGTGVAGTTAGTGTAGTGATGCQGGETCQSLMGLNFCGSSPFPATCTTAGMGCGPSGGTCQAGIPIIGMACIAICTP